jgi:pyruvate,orthophosphate dikinase
MPRRRTTPQTARKFGAEGIGLCRTEHMFFDPDRIVAVREMILADRTRGRRAALAKLLPMQRAGLRRPVQDHGRPAGHHPPARPAAARVPAARPTPRWRKVAKPPASTGAPKVHPRRAELDEANPMLGTAAAVSASPIRKSTRCRPAPSSRRRSRSDKTGT